MTGAALTIPGDWRRPGCPGPWRVVWSEDAGLGRLVPCPDPDEIPGFYAVDNYYTHGAAPAEAGPGPLPWRALRHLAWRADSGEEPDAAWWARLLGPDPRRCLDLGCGDGGDLAILAGLGHAVTGVEPDPEARAVATARGIAVHAGTAEAPPEALRGQRFDTVLMMHVLEHCHDPAVALRNAASRLAPDGVLVVETPNNACRGLAWFGEIWPWLDVPRHLHFFTAHSLAAHVRHTGLAVDRIAHRGYARQFGPAWLAMQDRIARSFGRPPRTGLAAQAAYLAATVAAPRDAKYDSVRVIARHPGGEADPTHPTKRDEP